MGKLIIGSFMFIAGLFFLATGVGAIIGIPMFAGGLMMGIAGLGSIGKTAVKTGMAAGQIVQNMQAGGAAPPPYAPSPYAPAKNGSGLDLRRWNTLVELDPEIAAAAEQVRAAGPGYEMQLAEKYLAVNDKQYLAAAVTKVLEQARLNEERRQHDEQIPERGTIGGSEYQRKAGGFFLIVKGKDAGRTFVTYDDMRKALEG